MSFKRYGIRLMCMLTYIMLVVQSIVPHYHDEDIHTTHLLEYPHEHHHHHHTDEAEHSSRSEDESHPECIVHFHHAAGECGLFAEKGKPSFSKQHPCDKVIAASVHYSLLVSGADIVSINGLSDNIFTSFYKDVFNLRGPPLS